ncbi:unnamed protein product [Closterium sp. NIES-53]
MIRHTSLRILLAVTASRRLPLRQIDVTNAFLYAPVDVNIFVEQPHGFVDDPSLVCQLLKSLYGIKQAPRLWQQYLHARFKRIGFDQLPHDQGMYRLTRDNDYVLLIVYQELVALSSAEAEYIALCTATKEGLYLRELLEEAKIAKVPNFSLLCDNQSAIRIANKNGFANRTKHIALRYFFVKDEIEKGKLQLDYSPTTEMAADYLTKKLPKGRFEYCMLLTGLDHVTEADHVDTPETKGSVGKYKRMT